MEANGHMLTRLRAMLKNVLSAKADHHMFARMLAMRHSSCGLEPHLMLLAVCLKKMLPGSMQEAVI